MVSKEQSIELILREFPDFQKNWQEYLKYWNGNSPGYSLDIAEFSRYVEDILKKDKPDDNLLKRIFNFIEKLMIEGDEQVQNGFATCFLENLINATSWGTITASSFVHLLGEESKRYCKAWDEFTGVKTEGL